MKRMEILGWGGGFGGKRESSVFEGLLLVWILGVSRMVWIGEFN